MCTTLLHSLLDNSMENDQIDHKQILFVSYLADLLRNQTNTSFLQDSLMVQSKSFDQSSIPIIISELFRYCESMSISSIEFACRKALLLLNDCLREHKVFSKLWDGLIDSINESKHPLVFLKQTCNSVESVEHMALLCEKSIDRSLNISTSGDEFWSPICNVLAVPELEASTFARYCSSHCLAYTLYAHGLQKLSKAGTQESQFLIGEQIGVWIESLKVQAVQESKERFE